MTKRKRIVPRTLTTSEHGETAYVTGAEVEAVGRQTIQIIMWADLPSTNERRIVARIATSRDVALAVNAKIRLALAETKPKKDKYLDVRTLQEE
jgi:hypothetical protein